MGAFTSRTVAVQVESTDLATPFVRLLLNFVCLGFIFGIILHNHDMSIWSFYFDQHLNFLRYAKGLYFLWYMITWYIVYTGFYILLFAVIVHNVMITLIGYRYEIQCELLLELLFGLWVAGQIIGSWLDLNRTTDCLKTKDCQSYFMQTVMNSMESVCEYFVAYEHDAARQVYIRREHNFCEDLFHAIPTILMTMLSTGLSCVMLQLIGPK